MGILHDLAREGLAHWWYCWGSNDAVALFSWIGGAAAAASGILIWRLKHDPSFSAPRWLPWAAVADIAAFVMLLVWLEGFVVYYCAVTTRMSDVPAVL